jgi:Leucine-rich repeat (LRR) protein
MEIIVSYIGKNTEDYFRGSEQEISKKLRELATYDVVSLVIKGDIENTLPENLQLVVSIEELEIQMYGMKELPVWISNLKNLIELDIHKTSIGHIPPQVASIQSLEDIFVSINHFSKKDVEKIESAYSHVSVFRHIK